MMPCKWILMICEGLCRLFDSLPGGNPVLGKPKLWQIVIYYGLLLGMVFMRDFSGKDLFGKEFFGKEFFKKRFFGKTLSGKTFPGKRYLRKNNSNRKRYIFIILAGVFLLCIRLRGATALTMLDIGQGDCMVIEEKSGYNILVDGGSSDVSGVGQYRMIPYLSLFPMPIPTIYRVFWKCFRRKEKKKLK